jgi:asparagine synthetase B (glutamine-hydrolysing)
VAAPYFRATLEGEHVTTSGAACFFGGHVLDADGSDGVFGRWEWSGAELRASVDAYGAYPLFYSACLRSVTISPSLLALVDAGVAPELDEEAVATFLRVGFFLGEDTPFRRIRVLPPAGRLRWRSGTLQITGGPFFAAASASSRDEVIDAFNAAFRDSISRRVRRGSRVLLPLSGGRDSRHILFALHEAGAAPDACVTVRPFPPRAAQEVCVAAAVAASVGVRHVVLEQSRARVAAERRKNRLTHFCSDEHAHFLALTDFLALHADTAYDGLGGDMLTGQSGALDATLVQLLYEDEFDRAAAHLFEGYGKRGIEAALQALLPVPLYRRFNRDGAMRRVRRELERHGAAPHPAMSFLFWNRTRRELALAPYALARGTQVFSPYLDRRLVALLLAVPPEITLDHRLHTDAIHRAYPGVARLPFEDGGVRRRNRTFVMRTAFDLLGVTVGRHAAVRRSYVLPRLLAAAVTGESAYLWFLPVALYLSDLCDRARA